MKLYEAEQWLKEQLRDVYDEREAGNIATWVLEKITGTGRLDRLVKRDQPLVVHHLHELTRVVQRLQQFEPVQYVLGEAPFAGLKFFVDKNVLVPRPETEELVAWIVSNVKEEGKKVFEKATAGADKTDELKILDVGTGCGCIALALKNAMPLAEVWGCDSSDGALNVARRNGAELDARVDFIALNFLDAAQRRQLPTVDIIVSNPPYVPFKDKNTMQANVLEYEPHSALFVPDDDPLVFYEAIAEFGKTRLHPGGKLYVEIHEDLGSSVVMLFKKHGYSEVVLKKDLQGKDRMVRAERE